MSESRQPWDENAQFWVGIIRENRDRYCTSLTNQAVQDAAGQVDGARILDAGCGEGYLSRFFADRGAKVTGIDFSAELIEAARNHKLTAELPVSFDVGSVDALPYEDSTFDLVLCNHVMNDFQDPEQAIAEFSRVLRPFGRVVIMMLHPCFYNKHAERSDQKNNLIASTYFDQRPVSQRWRTSFTRPLFLLITAQKWEKP